ncbi:MAG: transcription elongation factor GreA [Chitinophagales bacterium]
MQRLPRGVVFFFFYLNNKEDFMSEITYLTKDALLHLKAELQKMKSVDRPAASRAIAEAREKGDLRENAEYDAAKESQGLLEARIQKLESDLANVRILDEENIDTSKVSILTKVTVTNLNNKKQATYHLVSEKEADLKQGKISVSSPIGKGLLGKQIGEVTEVDVPAGKLKFKVENITV